MTILLAKFPSFEKLIAEIPFIFDLTQIFKNYYYFIKAFDFNYFIYFKFIITNYFK